MAKKKKADADGTPSVSDALAGFDGMAKKDIPAGVRKLANLTPSELKAASYRVSRISKDPASVLVIQIDGPNGRPGPGIAADHAKDPNETNPESPYYMTADEREAHPNGVMWSADLDARIVGILLEPGLAQHFAFTPND